MYRSASKGLLQLVSGGGFVYRLPGTKLLYLTFDDGPHPVYTPQVLALLRQHSVTCTFFLIGQHVEMYPDLVREMHADGHRVGLHTHTHRTIDRMSRVEFSAEIARNQQAIRDVIGLAPRLLRPPLGRVRASNLLWSAAQGLRLVHFTVTSNDWKAKSAADIVERVRSCKLRGGEIVNFHDNNPHTVEALELLLDELRQRAFSFEPISL